MYHDQPKRAGTVVGRKEVLVDRPDLKAIWDATDALFPVRITRSFLQRMNLSDPADPLARQVLPDPGELVPAEGDLDDPVGDAKCTPVPWVVRKHDDRALLLLTKRCHLYCRYCFRRTYSPTEAEDPTDAELATAIDYLKNAGLREVILSGGDPMAAKTSRILGSIDALREGGVRWIRIHSRALVTRPDRFDEAMCEALGQRGRIWVVTHANHPRELNQEVADAVRRLQRHGIGVLNQAVMLRGVNDDANTLVELSERLLEVGIKPYYLHHTDAVTGNAHFRVELERGLALYEAFKTKVSGLGVPRYVIDPPDGSGKVDVAAYLAERQA